MISFHSKANHLPYCTVEPQHKHLPDTNVFVWSKAILPRVSAFERFGVMSVTLLSERASLSLQKTVIYL